MGDRDSLEIPEIPTNPFLVDTVIIKILTHVKVSSLKELRKLDVKWEHFSTKELERRASTLGQIKAVKISELSWKEIDEFLEATFTSNLLLFRSFHLDFEFLNSYINIILKYSPILINLSLNNIPNFKENEKLLLLILGIIAPEIQELKITQYEKLVNQKAIEPTDYHPIFPKLTRLACIAVGEPIQPLKFLLNRDSEVDHTPNLTALEVKIYNWEAGPFDQLTTVGISRWCRLTKLTINCTRATPFLHSLGQGGMRLESLELSLILIHIAWMDWLGVCRDLSEFFQTQAQSLKILDLTCVCNFFGEDNSNSKIRLPIFEVLHTFKFMGHYHLMINEETVEADNGLFEMGPFPAHFPKLKHLEVHNCQILESIFPVGVRTCSMHLQSLTIIAQNQREYSFGFWKKTFKLLGEIFKSVVHLKIDGSLFQERLPKNSCVKSVRKFLGMTKVDGRKLAWKKSLRVLEIFNVKAPLHLSHLKGLEELIVIESKVPKNPDEYLSLFKNVRRLKLSKISFTFCDKHISDHIQNLDKIALYFRCPVVFL